MRYLHADGGAALTSKPLSSLVVDLHGDGLAVVADQPVVHLAVSCARRRASWAPFAPTGARLPLSAPTRGRSPCPTPPPAGGRSRPSSGRQTARRGEVAPLGNLLVRQLLHDQPGQLGLPRREAGLLGRSAVSEMPGWFWDTLQDRSTLPVAELNWKRARSGLLAIARYRLM